MSPEDAMKIILNEGKSTRGTVSMKTPKAGPTERKKAFAVGTQVRAMKKPRSKSEQDLSYKAYKGTHFGPVQKILKVKFIGVYPKYMLKNKVDAEGKWKRRTVPIKDKEGKVVKDADGNVKFHNVIQQRRKKVDGAFVKNAKGEYVKENVPQVQTPAVWKWGDEIIKARPGDTKSHNLIINRPIILPEKMRPKISSPKYTKRTAKFAKPKPKPKPKPKLFYKNQEVWYTGRKRVFATVLKDHGDTVHIKYFSRSDDKTLRRTVDKSTLEPLPIYEIGDQVRVYHKGLWHNGEVEAFNKKNTRYIVFCEEDNDRFEKEVTGQYLRQVS